MNYAKKKLTKVTTLSLAMTAALVLSACGSSATDSYSSNAYFNAGSGSSMAYETAAPSYADSAYYEEASFDNSSSGTEMVMDTSRKLIRNVSMSVETKEFDAALEQIKAQTTALGGYVEDFYSDNGTQYSSYSTRKNATLTIRIPSQMLDQFINDVGGYCNVVTRSETVRDVTLSYVDTASHKEALETEQDRLLELVSEADDMYTILEIEDRLAMVRYQIQSMESTLRTYDNQVDYSTVSLKISEVKELTQIEEEDPTVWERISEGFTDSLSDVAEGLVDFFVWFVVNLPRLIIWGLIALVAFLIFRKLRNPERARYAALKKIEKAEAKIAKKEAKKRAKQAKAEEKKESQEKEPESEEKQ